MKMIIESNVTIPLLKDDGTWLHVNNEMELSISDINSLDQDYLDTLKSKGLIKMVHDNVRSKFQKRV